MKKIFHVILFFGMIVIFPGCYDLDKDPQGDMSTTTAMNSVSEMESYLNQFYESGVRTMGSGYGNASGIAYGDQNSDNMLLGACPNRIGGYLTISDASELTNYDYIRGVNFLLENLDNSTESGDDFNQCVGEAYYFRAWYHFQLLNNYGEIAYVTKVLEIEEANMPRESRLDVADKILADLDTAIMFLQEQSSNATMRVHRDVARALKAEVALCEGTWQKYHEAKGTAFYSQEVTDQKINSYFEQARDAAKAVINRNVWKVYSTGKKTSDYLDLFCTLDLSGNSEILWFKKYDPSLGIGHSFTRYHCLGHGNTGLSQQLVDDYLTIEGEPYDAVTRLAAKKLPNSYGTDVSDIVRDPRLAQTVAKPGDQMKSSETGASDMFFTYPPLVLAAASSGSITNVSGYAIRKYLEWKDGSNVAAYNQEGQSAAPGIQCRYAEILLTYAEALAELDGAGNAQEIINTLKPLRDRIGMPAMNFDREFNSAPDYPFQDLDKYIQAVRRERRVELACENRRLSDIRRWAAADVCLTGKHLTGALWTGSELEEYFTTNYSGRFTVGQSSSSTIQINSEGYIEPYIDELPNGLGFKVDRDYLLPIQERMISLTSGENQWSQNPGWE